MISCGVELLGGALRDALLADIPLIGDLDDGLPARRAHVLARFERLLGESLALGGTHAFDRRLVIEGGQVACDGAGGIRDVDGEIGCYRLAGSDLMRGRRVGLVLSGGNVDRTVYAQVLAGES